MKNLFLSTLLLLASLGPAPAQFGSPGGGMGGPQGPDFSGAMAEFFGENKAFTAAIDMQTRINSQGSPISMPGKLSYLEGNARFEMDLTQMKGGGMPEGAAAQMKAMGMDRMVIISKADQKLTHLIYPALQAYANIPNESVKSGSSTNEFKTAVTEIGKETIDGHECVKNRVVVTDAKGEKTEATIWNATDLKKFPIKIETTQQGHAITMLFNDVKLAKPPASAFTPPADYKQYDSMMALVQQEMMKRMSEAAGK